MHTVEIERVEKKVDVPTILDAVPGQYFEVLEDFSVAIFHSEPDGKRNSKILAGEILCRVQAYDGWYPKNYGIFVRVSEPRVMLNVERWDNLSPTIRILDEGEKVVVTVGTVPVPKDDDDLSHLRKW